jgi:phosphohistidine swiveling domain-containing protein
MTKLTVYLKNNVVSSYSFSFEVGKLHIGRDDTNDVVIDSPMLAPVHAVIMVRGGNAAIKQLNTNFPLIINGKDTKESILNDGDAITIGQHIVVYSVEQTEQSKETINIVEPTNPKVKEGYIPHVANYQIISGTGIGKIFHIKNSMTRIGEPGSGIVVVSKRKDGYFVSVLENTGIITLNKNPLAQHMVKLDHRDILVLDNTTIQFYLH